MKSVKRTIEKNILSRFPLVLSRFFSNVNLLVPSYHLVSDDDVLHVKYLNIQRKIAHFKNDLEFLLKYYKPVYLIDLIEALNNGRRIPDNSFLLTFDDGFKECYNVIGPILKSKGIPATFFLTNNFIDNKSLFYRNKACIIIEYLLKTKDQNCLKDVKELFISNGKVFKEIKQSILSIEYSERGLIDKIAETTGINYDDYLEKKKPYLTSGQVESLIKDGFTIGAHSLDHLKIQDLNFSDQIFQTKESVNLIKERFKVNYSAFAFPFTDAGMSKKYFENVFQECIIDVSFGSSGLVDSDFPKSIQRIWMEDTEMSPVEIMRMQYAKRIIKKMLGKGRIVRD